MVAELAPTYSTPSLLFEPDPLVFDAQTGRWVGRKKGWRVKNKLVVRWNDDDAWGAVVQEIIVRYVLHGIERQQLAREYPISQRQIQAYVTGYGRTDHAYEAYSAPVRRALMRLGFTPGRHTIEKQIQALPAIRRIAADLLLLLDKDTRPAAREIRPCLRLLAEVGNDGR